ncbi:hypothetical protein [Mongoliimonas terrestris]|uniref:hypothetical protein n=1 Tax=Mongoliimonas terrestris TaxID=1709001 RepID=UPI0009497268|nr:hypothetical protein [Mongoliimonas terrestris]
MQAPQSAVRAANPRAVPLLDAGAFRCRNPLFDVVQGVAPSSLLVCGNDVIPGRWFCATCKPRLVSSVRVSPVRAPR